MTAKPAQAFHLLNRGVLKVGNFADIVIFNEETVGDRGTFIAPEQYPVGIEYVLINGNIVIHSGIYEKISAGKVLRQPL